jgi:hypothetical protein
MPSMTQSSYPSADTSPGPPDRDLLDQLAERHALRGPIRRLLAAIDTAGLADGGQTPG